MRKWECEQKKDKWNTYYKKTMWCVYQMEIPRTEREKMLAGELYDCGEAELLTQWHKAKDLVRDYNQMNSADADEKERILNELLGGKGKNLWITAPFYVDYGNNIYFGNNCEVNMGCKYFNQGYNCRNHSGKLCKTVFRFQHDAAHLFGSSDWNCIREDRGAFQIIKGYIRSMQ